MDIILEKFMEEERWQAAIAHAVDKDVRKDQLIELTRPYERAKIYADIRDGRYRISPPHTAKIEKDTPGEYRIVYVNEPKDRVILNIINDLLIDLMPGLIHLCCKSYQKGIGCGMVVQDISHKLCEADGAVIGFKADLSKYFDRVPIRYIDEVFDKVEAKWGKSMLIKVVRDYYHSDIYFDVDGNLCSTYQSLKQGCAVAAFLANAVLKHIDEKMSTMFVGEYRRYSDDILYDGPDYEAAMECLRSELALMEMELNPKKVELLSRDTWFTFLGFSIKGADISISRNRLKTFQEEIESRTIKDRKTSFDKALGSVMRYLYKGDGEHSWATQILPIINVKKDLDILNGFIMDCLRAVWTGKRKVGGLGYVGHQGMGCITRGTGRNVKANRLKMPHIDGYISLGCMKKDLKNKHLYRVLVNTAA